MAPALTIQFIGMVGILVVGVVVASRLPNRPPADTASVTANSMAEPQAA
jgi:hypothetical protein